MLNQLIPEIEYLHTLAEIMEVIFGVVQPIVSPIGEFWVSWISYLLQFFPSTNLIFYYVVFAVILVLGIIVNIKWPGDESTNKKERKKLTKSDAASGYSLGDTLGPTTKQSVNTSEPTLSDQVETQDVCRDCGLPLGGAKICQYCGANQT